MLVRLMGALLTPTRNRDYPLFYSGRHRARSLLRVGVGAMRSSDDHLPTDEPA